MARNSLLGITILVIALSHDPNTYLASANESRPTVIGDETIYFPSNVTPASDLQPQNEDEPAISINIVPSSNHGSHAEVGDHEHHADEGDHSRHGAHGEEHHGGIHLASWRWEEYSSLVVFILVIITAAVLKLLFHHCHCLASYFPESCVLIIIGIVFGAWATFGLSEDHQDHLPKFTAELFFNFLLPPIILDAAYAIYDPEFLSNLGSVLIFAVAGTLFNVFTIGYGLYIVNFIGAIGQFPAVEISTIMNETMTQTALRDNLTAVECLTFSSLISAVDPVAVLAIFEDIGVNRGLYFLVFGESLLNDGVTVVLYNSMVALGNLENPSTVDYLMVFLSFFTVVFGGFTIGCIIGLISSYIVKFTKQTRVIEPLIILTMAYLSYILAETIHWSGIISLIGCGVFQKRYAFRNISRKSNITVKYAVKTMAAICDCMIFLFLGYVTITDHVWHTGFTLWTCFFCLIFRFASVYFLSAIINRTRVKPISLSEQFIMSYGGLRGAVGFSLAQVLSDNNPYKQMFLTTTIFMVFFTVFIQGGTIKFLVNKLGITKHEEGVSNI